MGNNAEIRKRMETYRNILLAFVWIGAAIGLIGGFMMMDGPYPIQSFGIPLIIISIIGGIIGHFLVNVALAIPFILLNNGDTLAALVGGNEKNTNAHGINKEAMICRFCGRDIAGYENEQRMKLDEEKKKKELEFREKYKSFEDLFNDADIMEHAKELRRIYGKDLYILYLKTKAKELGLGDIDLHENDID
ncbi:MAG: hypothetical protein LBG84_00090 [Treponema sp.]|jgi:hypothetical protein|nr:hypothetical protein [Treponema sp.]